MQVAEVAGQGPDPSVADRLVPIGDALPLLLQLFPEKSKGWATNRLLEGLDVRGPSSLSIIDWVCEEEERANKLVKDEKEQNNKRGTKRKASPQSSESEAEASQTHQTKDYYRQDRAPPSGKRYKDLAVKLLKEEFPDVSLAFIRDVLKSRGGLYATARRVLFEAAAAEDKRETHTVASKSKRRKRSANETQTFHEWSEERRQRAQNLLSTMTDIPQELKEEAEWVLEPQGQVVGPESEDCEIECGCCFEQATRFDDLVQCSEGHLFCKSCTQSYVETQIGMRKTEVRCMNTGDCDSHFAEGELLRSLSEKTYMLLNQIRQDEELKKAEVGQLVSCPFCPYACIIEDEEETLFRCQRPDCGKVSCLSCKEQDHSPLSCQDVKNKRRTTAEDALSEALIRRCPTADCNTPLIKEHGCNKLQCTRCRKFMCYVCKKAVKDYKHFEQTSTSRDLPQPAVGRKCPLWDDTEKRHEADVEQARAKLGAEALPK